MQTATEVRKEKRSIDEVLGQHREKAVEEPGQVNVAGPDRFLELIREYETILEIANDDDVNRYVSGLGFIFTPREIDSFLQATAPYEEHEEYPWRTGTLISHMIQKSYDAGHNGFELRTANLQTIDYLIIGVKGKHYRPIDITIDGDTGVGCGCAVAYTNLTITGNTEEEFGGGAMYSTFNIHGDTGWGLADDAEDCTFTIHGRIRHELSTDRHSVPFAFWCTFKTPNKKTLELLKRYIPTEADGNLTENKLVYICKNGKEKPVRLYGSDN